MSPAGDAGIGVGTANVWSGRALEPGPGGGALLDPARLRAAGELLAAHGVDVLAVQEVDHDQPRSGRVDQLAVLAEGFGAVDRRFAPTLSGVPGTGRGRGWRPHEGSDGASGGQGRGPSGPADPSYGVGLVSRLPVLAWRVRALRGSRAVVPMALPGQGRPRVIWVADEPRVALAAVVAAPGGRPVTVIATHLSFAPLTALRQLRAICRWASSLPGPRVLAGDLNLPGPVAAWRSGWHRLGRAPTFPAARPRVQLDHLLTDAPLSAVNGAAALRLPLSDHRALVSRLSLPSVN